MANAIGKVIKKIRHKFKPPQKIETRIERLVVEIKSEQYRSEFWERDKKQQRSMSFEKAKAVLKINKEKKKQRREAMLKNLEKARKAKEKHNGK